MKISLIGYGKMGKLIKEKALSLGHTVEAIVDSKTALSSLLLKKQISESDVCIDFSHPSCVVENIKWLAAMKKNIVVGTTGWTDKVGEVRKVVEASNIGLFYSPNFAFGVSLFLAIVEHAAALVAPHREYDVSGIEIHHKKKVDSPSGTAKTLAEVVNQHYLDLTNPMTFSSVRVGEVPGTYSILFDSKDDTITLTHTARNRDGYATGAIRAAEWLCGKQGWFSMDDLLKLRTHD